DLIMIEEDSLNSCLDQHERTDDQTHEKGVTAMPLDEIFLYHDEVRCWRIVPIVLIWLATFSLSVPCHRQLQNHGKVLSTINRLVVTNWIRTLLWSLLFLRTGLAAYHLPLF
ncbi:MAG: hypothetical protein KJ985_13980, partial [Proteobacteria bacterium]|nr:hypothetical protein [Pseudomonadota bacterium]